MAPFFTIFIWIFFSFSACLQANPIGDFRFRNLERDVLCPSNTTFHVPTNVKVSCVTDALVCFQTGLDTAKCQDEKNDMGYAAEALSARIAVQKEAGNPPTNSTDCACEGFPRLPFRKFLKEMKSLVQSTMG